MAKKRKRRTKKRLLKLNLWLWVSSILIIAIGATFWSQTLIYDKQQPTSQDAVRQQKIDWINQLAPYARQMQEKYGVIASISIAQAILESDWHTSTLATQYNNLYGITLFFLYTSFLNLNIMFTIDLFMLQHSIQL